MTCQTPWHPEITVSQVGRDNREDEMKALLLAQDNRWTRCPSCTYVVAMINGCNNVQCICGRHFCYECGRGSETSNGRCFNLSRTEVNRLRQDIFAYQT